MTYAMNVSGVSGRVEKVAYPSTYIHLHALSYIAHPIVTLSRLPRTRSLSLPALVLDVHVEITIHTPASTCIFRNIDLAYTPPPHSATTTTMLAGLSSDGSVCLFSGPWRYPKDSPV